MSDIIQDAKRLLDGATPAPWEPHPDLPKCLVNLETQFAVAVVPESDVQGSEDESNRNLIAAAPELAQALAEETWEYRYERKLIYQTNEWIPMGDGHKWYSTPELAKRATSHEPNSLPVRLTRRRVSPSEVIND